MMDQTIVEIRGKQLKELLENPEVYPVGSETIKKVLYLGWYGGLSVTARRFNALRTGEY